MELSKSWDEIEKLVYPMRPYLVIAGVRKSTIEVHPRRCKDDELRRTINWLEETLLPLVTQLRRTYNLVPEETWNNYKLYFIEGLQEQELLEQHKELVKEEWQKRPRLLRKTHAKVKKQEVGS